MKDSYEYLEALEARENEFFELTKKISMLRAWKRQCPEKQREADEKLVYKMTTEKLRSLYHLFFTIDKFVEKRKIELQGFRLSELTLDEMRSINDSLTDFYYEFPEVDDIIKEFKRRIFKLENKEKAL